MIGKGAFLLVFVFLLMMYILVATTNSMFILQHKAGLQPLGGGVEVQKKGTSEWSHVSSNAFVTAGDWVRTGTQGQAELRWIGPTRVRVDPQTTLLVQSAMSNRLNQSKTAVFRLDLGKVWVRVARLLSPKDRLEVRTPTATVAAHGTVFSVHVDPETETAVEVFSGQVQVQGKQGPQRLFQLQPQQQIAVGPHIFHPTLTPMDPADLSDWKQQDILKPHLLVSPASIPQRTRQYRLALTGETEPQATVTVNQQPAAVDPQGVFSFHLDLQPGTNEIEIIARDPAGYTNAVKRTVVLMESPNQNPQAVAGEGEAGVPSPPNVSPPSAIDSPASP
jgi:hypothetical protein